MSHLHPGVVVGDFGDSKVLSWRQASLVAEGGTAVYEYLDKLPHLPEDGIYLPTLLDRFLGHNGAAKINCGVFAWAVYWDGVIILGAVPNVALCLKTHHGLVEVLKLGLDAFKREFEHVLSDFGPDWQKQVIVPVVPVVEIPHLSWQYQKD